MSNLVFPQVGHAYSVIKTPTSATRTQRAVSGRELTLRDYANPIWNFRFTFDALHETPVAPAVLPSLIGDVKRLMDFFNQVGGSYDTWLFDDTTDDSVVDSVLVPVPNDATRTKYQLVRRLYANGLAEAIIAPHTITNVKIDGSPTAAYTLDLSTGIVTFDSAQIPESIITSTFSFYFRCRFMTDAVDFENFSFNRWQIPELRFKSIVL